ncbi:MAG: disulfide bond formation protein B, partial [Parachlamydiales bacterium]|nr:disulfide bond formation protein B [Parachlamydiales bacterium]
MKFFRSWALYFAWVIALIATLSSIYSSEMLNYQPCIFCWYQRIFMFPLVIILGIGVYTRDPKVVTYAIAFPVLGALVALYQTLIIYL